MIKREKYLAEIRGFYDSDLVKIITGVRRSGKSVILEQIMQELKQKSDNVVYIDFEDRAVTANLVTASDIVNFVNSRRKDGLCYVLLDEVQEIEDWASACKSLRRENCSVFITGSNSKLLSSEFARELSGRFVSFRVRPFVYNELCAYAEQLDKAVTVTDYLVWGGFPKRIEFDTEQEVRRYISDLDRTIVQNDLVTRYKIRKTVEFSKFVNFLALSNARIYSAKSIATCLAGNGCPCTANSVQKWIACLSEAFIIDELQKYSRKAKKELSQSQKLYLCDVALNSVRCHDNRYDLTHNMENIVYNELLYQGFSVFVYDNCGKEIDFLAERNGLKYYIQVAYSVMEEKTYAREFRAFKGLSQLDRKIIITNDEIDYSTSNVQHIKFRDFLTKGI